MFGHEEHTGAANDNAKTAAVGEVAQRLVSQASKADYWYDTLTMINHVAAKRVQRQMVQAQAEIQLHKRRQRKKLVGYQGPGDPVRPFYLFDEKILVCCHFADTATVKLLRGK